MIFLYFLGEFYAEKIREFTDKHAIPAALIVFVLFDLIITGLSKLLLLLPQTLPSKYLFETVMMLVPVAFVFFFGFSRAFTKGNLFRGLLCCLPFVLYQLLLFVYVFTQNANDPEVCWNPWYMIVFGLFSIIGIGVREECIYRATIQNIIAKKYANSIKGIRLTVIVSAILFGLCHITNVFHGMNPLSVLSQIVTATAIGLLFGAVYLRTGSLWALILIHSLTDAVSLGKSVFFSNFSELEIANGLSFSWSRLIFELTLVGITAFLLRPSKCREIIARFEAEHGEALSE